MWFYVYLWIHIIIFYLKYLYYVCIWILLIFRCIFRLSRLVPDLIDDDYPSSKSDSSDQEDESSARTTKALNAKNAALLSNGATTVTSSDHLKSKSSDEDDEICDGLRTINGQTKFEDSSQSIVITTLDTSTVSPAVKIPSHAVHLDRISSMSFHPGQVERRRRKLPEIPKNKKCEYDHYCM